MLTVITIWYLDIKHITTSNCNSKSDRIRKKHRVDFTAHRVDFGNILLVLRGEVEGGLVENVHDDERKVDDHEDAEEVPAEAEVDSDHPPVVVGDVAGLHVPAADNVLATDGGPEVCEVAHCQVGQTVVILNKGFKNVSFVDLRTVIEYF